MYCTDYRDGVNRPFVVPCIQAYTYTAIHSIPYICILVIRTLLGNRTSIYCYIMRMGAMSIAYTVMAYYTYEDRWNTMDPRNQ